jgi:hypothetical protein
LSFFIPLFVENILFIIYWHFNNGW